MNGAEFPEFLYALLYERVGRGAGLTLRVACRAALAEWKRFCRREPFEPLWPSRTFVYMRRCQACGREGEGMAKVRVPWSVFPPKAVYVVCPSAGCKYAALRSIGEREGVVPLMNRKGALFPDSVTIERSDGRAQKARCSERYLVRRPEGLYASAWWIDRDGLFQKLVLLDDLRSQALGRPRPVRHLFR